LVALAERQNSAALRRREEECRLPRVVPRAGSLLHRETSRIFIATAGVPPRFHRDAVGPEDRERAGEQRCHGAARCRVAQDGAATSRENPAAAADARRRFLRSVRL